MTRKKILITVAIVEASLVLLDAWVLWCDHKSLSVL